MRPRSFNSTLASRVLGLSARARAARHDPHGPSVYRGFALQPQVEQIGYLRKESELAFALLLRFLQTALPFGRRFLAQLAGLAIQSLLFAARLVRAQRFAIPLQRAAMRLPSRISVSQVSCLVDPTLPLESKCRSTECPCQV